MSNRDFEAKLSSRSLLYSTAAFLIAGMTSGSARTISGAMPWSPGTATPPLAVRPGPWMFFTADEVALMEAAVDRLIPPDDRGPGGKDAGCAIFIDRQLAGPYGHAAGLYTRPPFLPGVATQGYQLPESPAARYRAGLKALAGHIKEAFGGKAFHELASADQDKVLSGLENGSIALKDIKSTDFFALLCKIRSKAFSPTRSMAATATWRDGSWLVSRVPATTIGTGSTATTRFTRCLVSIMGRSDWTGKE
jgi:gluconate 2-dehydrogenase gamma chain